MLHQFREVEKLNKATVAGLSQSISPPRSMPLMQSLTESVINRTSSFDEMGMTRSQRLLHEENRSRGNSIVSKMQDFLLMFDDYNYKLLNDDVGRVVNVIKRDVERYNHETLRRQIMDEREQRKAQTRKGLEVYDSGSLKARKKSSILTPTRKESKKNLELYEKSSSDEEDPERQLIA